jgi:transcription elongation factor GreA-like protein
MFDDEEDTMTPKDLLHRKFREVNRDLSRIEGYLRQNEIIRAYDNLQRIYKDMEALQKETMKLIPDK